MIETCLCVCVCGWGVWKHFALLPVTSKIISINLHVHYIFLMTVALPTIVNLPVPGLLDPF